MTNAEKEIIFNFIEKKLETKEYIDEARKKAKAENDMYGLECIDKFENDIGLKYRIKDIYGLAKELGILEEYMEKYAH